MNGIENLEKSAEEVLAGKGTLEKIYESVSAGRNLESKLAVVGRNALALQGNVGDGDIHIVMINENNRATAVLGISCGLENYYRMLFEELAAGKEEEQYQKYADAIESMQEKYVVTQIQGVPGMGEYRKGMKWKEMLLATAEEIIKRTGEKESFILPSELNLWISPTVKDWLLIGGMSQAEENVLKRNYDKLAERSGYERASELSGVYCKGLK